MSARNMIISFMVVGLFVFSMITFGIGIATLNNGQSIASDQRINSTYGSYVTQLADVQSTAEQQRDKFDSESPTLSFGEILFESIVGVGRTFTSSMVGFMDTTFNLIFVTIFGGDPTFAVVIGTIIGIVLLSIVFLLWRVYKAGE